MRIAIAAALGAALVVTGVAVAHLSASGTTAVGATFNATTVVRFDSRTCTGADGQYQLVDAVYSGTAVSSDTSLAGTVRARIKSVYNTTKKLGWAAGWLRFHDQGDDDSHGAGSFDAGATVPA